VVATCRWLVVKSKEKKSLESVGWKWSGRVGAVLEIQPEIEYFFWQDVAVKIVIFSKAIFRNGAN
jgi:hypothetical protein